MAFKLTVTSYSDSFTRGLDDATCDINQCHGHGYDPSCPSGHTKTFCSDYAQGYSKAWVQQPETESKSQAQSIVGNDVGINGNNNRVIINQVQNQK